MFGGFLLLCDAILLPVTLAWELDMASENVTGAPLAQSCVGHKRQGLGVRLRGEGSRAPSKLKPFEPFLC